MLPERLSFLRDRQPAAALLLLAGVLLFYELGDARTLGSHEAFAVVPAREMLDSGDWIVPRYGGIPRLEKPPLPYWAVAGSARLFGELNETTARLPAACAALLTAVLMGVWAGRWYGRTAAFGAAMVQLSSLYVLIYGRKAEVDMLLCLLTTAAMFLIAHSPRDEQFGFAFLRWIGIYALLAAGWLAKFHYGAAMVLIPCVLYLALQRRWRSLGHAVNPVGLLLIAAAAFIWPSLVAAQVPEAWDIWRTETVGRAVGDLSKQPIWYYLPYLVSLSLPWTPLAVAAVPHSWRRAWKRKDARERFLWIWFVVQLAIVSASANKHKHYLLATLPMFSLLAAQNWVRLVERARSGKPFFAPQWRMPAALGCVCFSTIAAGILVARWPFLMWPAIVLGILLTAGGCLTVWWSGRNRPRSAGWTVLVVALSAYAVALSWIVPARDHRLPSAEFAKLVREQFAEGRTVCVFRLGQDPLLFYLGAPAIRLEESPQLQAALAQHRRMLVLTSEVRVDELHDVAECRPIAQMQPDPNLAERVNRRLVLMEVFRQNESEPPRSPERLAADREDERGTR